MAEIPGILPGPFPDGVFGFRGLRRNKGIIEQQAERILGDDAALAVLEKTGQSAAVELLIDQGMRARTRAEQRPVMGALAGIIDGLGLFERDQFIAADYDAAINESIMAAAQFVGPEQREELAQLADAQARAYERAAFQPTEGLTDMQAVSDRVLEITRTAGDRIESEWLSPLRELKFDTATIRQQLLDAGGDNLQANATPQEVLQVLNFVNSQTSQEFGGFALNIPFLGGITPDDVPNLTYAELLNTLHSREKGAEQFVNAELEKRGAQTIAAAPTRLLATPKQDEAAATKAVNDAINEVYNNGGIPDPGMANFGSGPQQLNAIERWLQSLPQGAQLDAQNSVAITPDGKTYQPPQSARTLLEQQRRMRANRARSQIND